MSYMKSYHQYVLEKKLFLMPDRVIEIWENAVLKP